MKTIKKKTLENLFKKMIKVYGKGRLVWVDKHSTEPKKDAFIERQIYKYEDIWDYLKIGSKILIFATYREDAGGAYHIRNRGDKCVSGSLKDAYENIHLSNIYGREKRKSFIRVLRLHKFANPTNEFENMIDEYFIYKIVE